MDETDKPAESDLARSTTPTPPPTIPECEADLVQLLASRQEAARASAPPREAKMSRFEEIAAKIKAAMPDPETVEAERRRWEAEQQEQKIALRLRRWTTLIEERGERYAECRLKNFKSTTAAQEQALEALDAYCRNMPALLAAGQGVLLFGPTGAGKDHLLMALARVAIIYDYDVAWQNGMDLFGAIRDAMDAETPERALVRRLVEPDVLYLSDPLRPVGVLTDFQMEMLYRILDGRYSRRRPTWCSVNVAKRGRADRTDRSAELQPAARQHADRALQLGGLPAAAEAWRAA